MPSVLTGVESGVLLHVTKLLEAPVAIRAFVGFLSRVNADVLDQLVVGRERLETLLALVWLHLAAMGDDGFPSMHLHRRFVHEDLFRAKIIFISIIIASSNENYPNTDFNFNNSWLLSIITL
jgi:hypothetical protein